MDDIARCKNQLSSFRIKELKDVLTRLGLPKQGKKQVLMDKIMAVLVPEWQQQQPLQKGLKSEVRSLGRGSVSREEAAKVIDDIYRKLRGPGAVELASAPRTVPTISEQEETPAWEVRCPCGSSLDTGTMIQCDNQACNVWQHLNCVVIPENTVEGADPEVPSQFYCEICRINFGDPFCVTLSQPLPASKFFAPPALKMEGGSPLHSLDRTFTLTKADRETLHKPNHDLQVWCLLLNDKVPFRMHWPAFAELRVNGVSLRVTPRAGTQLLGVNGRDDGVGIITCSREGTNRISLQACDARPFCMGVRIIRRLSVEQVMKQIPSVSAGEPFEDALARVKRCINGGVGDTGDDGDSDIEVVADFVTVSLSCPMSGSRINVAGRFKPCAHMGGFDLRTFVELNQKTRKWQCPVCMKNYSLEHLIIDPFFNRVTQAMKSYAEDVKEVELKADGLWRPKLEGDARMKEPWRNPDGSVVLSNGIHKPLKQEDGISQGRTSLKIGMKRTHDGSWAVNKKKNSNDAPKQKEPSFSRSSSATDSNNEDDERSVNQEPYAKEYTGDNEAGLQKLNLPINAWKKNKQTVTEAPPNGNAGDLIVLSDSDEESGSPAGTYMNGKSNTGVPSFGSRKDRLANGGPGMAGHNGSSRHGSDSAMGLPPLAGSHYWAPQPSQDVPYRFFESGTGPIRSAMENAEFGMRSDRQMLPDFTNPSGSHYDMEEDGTEEMGTQKFRLFLPPQPAREPPQAAVQGPVANHDEELDDTWFSLSLGGTDLNHDVGMPSSSHEYVRTGRERLDTLANTASTVLLGLNNNNHNDTNMNNGAGSLGHSRRNNHHLSRHHRSYFRVESDSE